MEQVAGPPAAAPRAPFRSRVAWFGGGVGVGVQGNGGTYLCPPTCESRPLEFSALPEVAAALEVGGERVRLHLELTARFWFYSDAALDLPTYSLGVDLGPPAWHGTLYVHGLNVVIPYVLGMRIAHSPPPVEGRNAPFFAVRLEKPLGTLPPTVHLELGVQWWLDRPPRPDHDPLPAGKELDALPEAPGD